MFEPNLPVFCSVQIDDGIILAVPAYNTQTITVQLIPNTNLKREME